MGIDIVNNRILHTGKSRENPVWLWYVTSLPSLQLNNSSLTHHIQFSRLRRRRLRLSVFPMQCLFTSWPYHWVE